MKVKMTKEQVNSGRLIPNGEYSGVIIGASDEESSSGNDMLVVDIQVENHPEYGGCVVRDWLGVWFRGADKFRRFIEALTGEKYNYEKEYNLTESSLKGKKLKFYNQQGKDDKDMPVNSITDYKSL